MPKLSFLSLLFFLTGCHQESATNRPLIFWCSNNAGEIAFARVFTQQWQKQRPDKPLRYQPIPG